jgi:hypothetical protein
MVFRLVFQHEHQTSIECKIRHPSFDLLELECRTDIASNSASFLQQAAAFPQLHRDIWDSCMTRRDKCSECLSAEVPDTLSMGTNYLKN